MGAKIVIVTGLSMYVLASARYNVEIVHRFLEVGHTQKEGDSMHDLIENRSKCLAIFSSFDWVTVMRTAKSGQKPYHVVEVERGMIFDLNNVGNNQNWEKDTMNQKVRLSHIREIRTGEGDNHILRFKYEFDGDLCDLNLKQTRGRFELSKT